MGVFKALYGGSSGNTIVGPGAPVRQDDPTASKGLDPNRSDAVAEARRRRLALSRRKGRSALRVDLADDSTQTRSGVSIR